MLDSSDPVHSMDDLLRFNSVNRQDNVMSECCGAAEITD